MATNLAKLTREQIDCLLRMHVRERAVCQDAVVLELDAIDRHTARIDELMEAREKAPV